MLRWLWYMVAAIAGLSLSACGSQVSPLQAGDSTAQSASSSSPSASLTLPSDPPQSADPGQLLYATNQVLTIDHTGKYEWHSRELPSSSGTPSAILFTYRFVGDVQSSNVDARPEILTDGGSDIIFTFDVNSYSGSAVVQIIKAAAHELDAEASQ